MPHRKVDWSLRRVATVTMTNTGVAVSLRALRLRLRLRLEHMTFGDTGVESRDGNMSDRQAVGARRHHYLPGQTSGSDSANLLHIREATVIMTNSPAGEYTLVRSR